MQTSDSAPLLEILSTIDDDNDDLTMTSMKRKRLNDGDDQVSKKSQKTSTSVKKGSKPGFNEIPLPVEQLQWKKVTLPDRLEDAEGFFGLEEIEDIEVVKDSASGNVTFKLRSGPTEKIRKPACTTNEEEEWAGIGDKEIEKTSRLNTGPKENSKKQKKQKSKVKSTGSSVITNGQSNNSNAFSLLGVPEEEDVDVSAWMSLDLSSETLSSLSSLRFTRPTPIQRASIPEILNGHDVIGKAATGSGKTLAYGIPILEHFLASNPTTQLEEEYDADTKRRRPPVAMILSPTRELAHQISAHLAALCATPSALTPRIATLTGGLSLQKQQRLLANADIIIGTPGRLWEVINESQGLLKWLRQVKFLVVDEADRLLTEGHFKEVEEILNSLERGDEEPDNSEKRPGKVERQSLVFSATFQKELQQKLANKGKAENNLMSKQESMDYLLKKLNFREDKLKLIDVNPISQMASNLKEGLLECSGLEKDLYLYALLLHHPNFRILIFANSISSVRRLTPFLQNLNIAAHAIHSQMPQKARLRAIERFSSDKNPGSILIATDVAARGLDIPSVQLIIHYHIPRTADSYVHRSGRTARAGKSGSSILLCAPEEVIGVRRLVAKVHACYSDTPDSDKKTRYFIRTIDLDRRIVARLKPRASLSKRISDACLAKEKINHEYTWLRTAAEDLGVDYDSEEFAAEEGSKKGRGQGRRMKDREAKGLSKGDLGKMKAELKSLLAQRVNVGVSEVYLSAGGVDVDELLKEGEKGEFLGRVEGVIMD